MFVIFIVWESFGKQGQEVLSHPNPYVIVSPYPQKNECYRIIGKYSMSDFERFQARHCKKVYALVGSVTLTTIWYIDIRG